MKRGFLQLSFLLVIITLTQSSLLATGEETKGKYTARTDADQATASYFYNLRANQKTGLIDPMLAAKVSEQVKATAESRADLSWVELGPNNFAGQVNAIIVDNQTASGKTLFAGTLGGGIYKSTDEAVTWTKVSENMMVSDMIQAADGTIYVATGLGLNSQSYSGLSEISYSSGLIGQGLFKSTDGGNTFLQIGSTVPAINDNAATWAYINELALTADGTLLVATGSALMVSTNGGETWEKAKDIESNELNGNVVNVKVASDGTLIASVDGEFYISTSGNINEFENRSTGEEGMLPTQVTSVHLIIAVAPTDPNVMYAASIQSSGTQNSIYVSKDKGSSWRVILPSSTTIKPYDGDGLNYNKIIVDPENTDKIILCAKDLWTAKGVDNTGLYSWEVSSISSYSPYDPLYIHPGIHSLTYSATSNNKFYIGTEGGVFKATIAAGNYSFAQCNRNLISGRFWNVGVSHKLNRVIGGSVDNGTVFILGSETENNLKYGKKIQVGLDNFVGGQSAISVIDPDVFIITAKGNIVRRTNEMGTELSQNFSESQFLTGLTSNTSFKTPIVLWESDKDFRSYDSVWFKSKDTLVAGEKIQVISNNGGHPFEHVLTEDLNPGDSILVQDIISSKLFVAAKDNLVVTREILQFGKVPVIYTISKKTAAGVSGTPQSLAVSADADHAFVGTTDGKLYRVSNIADAYVDSLATAGGAACIITTTEIALNTPEGANSQAITSISVDQKDANKVIVTLANYGNQTYVYYSTNALSENPIFVQKQGDLPLMPVYASLIEMSNTNVVILGTEHGIYMTDDITIENPVWYKSQNAMEDIPVFELKQQTFEKGWAEVILPPASPTDPEIIVSYQGVDNYGSIYAATYGRGLFRCDEYRIVGLDENPGNALGGSATKLPMSLYPNPVSNQTRVAFEVIGNTAQINCHVYDLSGRVVYSEILGQFANGKHEVQLPLSNLNSGAYILHVQDGQRSNACKFMVY
ncbi:MAG: T9SS type A sorting domain-containing protein [Lentimicrobiaceae bacterium]|jgi:photosystem II stability/assembly factor-like uncharacterized protein|nr:T9SS type A sorting domain-containing protein [Lentimicrobiaceae bacterium]